MRTHISTDETFGLFHACSTCGGSCQGVIISLLDEEEAQRVERFGAELGVPEPVADGRLSLVDGHCAFLGEDNLCRIHKQFGLEAKPTVCKQFPMVAIRAEEGLRIGVDPACYSAFFSVEDGPPVGSGSLVATGSQLEDSQRAFETKFLQLCEVDGVGVATLASWLSGEQPSAQRLLPAGFEERVVERVREAELVEWVEKNPVGRAIRTSLLPVLQFAEQGGKSRWTELDSDADSWAVEAIRRVVFLRLTGDVPTVPGSALLLVAGAILCGRANPGADNFSRALAAWIRAVRFRQFWARFAPDAATMARLLRP